MADLLSIRGDKMTYAEREAIMSKDIISVAEIKELLGVGESEASRVRGNIIESIELAGRKPRITARGKLHTQDFCDYYHIERR